MIIPRDEDLVGEHQRGSILFIHAHLSELLTNLIDDRESSDQEGDTSQSSGSGEGASIEEDGGLSFSGTKESLLENDNFPTRRVLSSSIDSALYINSLGVIIGNSAGVTEETLGAEVLSQNGLSPSKNTSTPILSTSNSGAGSGACSVKAKATKSLASVWALMWIALAFFIWQLLGLTESVLANKKSKHCDD